MAHAEVAHFTRRLASRWQPACWTAVVVRVIPARETVEDGVLVRTPDHFLGAAWPPAAEGPARWPEVVVIGSPGSDNALAELFLHLPGDARVFLAGVDDVDAALAAQILLAADHNLEPYQRDGLAAFAAAERERTAAAIDARYTDRDAGFERFRARLFGRGSA
jgi:hypothetical protein